jgi:hypothetical protein
MKKKLTLVIDESVIERAKRHARSIDSTVSDMVEGYLIEQTSQESWEPPAGSALSRLLGSAPLVDTENDIDEVREKALRQKHA